MKRIEPGLFIGKVVHQRLRPLSHRLEYRVASVLVDVDRLEALPGLMRYNRFGLFGLSDADFGEARTGISVQTHAWSQMKAHGAPAAVSRILVLCYPRILGFAFNPLTVFFGLDVEDRVRMVLYEVHNTFGGRKIYSAGPFEPGDDVFAVVEKTFRVSPFNKVEGRYGLRCSLPGASVAVGVTLTTVEGPLLKAYFAGERQTLSNPNLLRFFFGLPLMTLKVVAGIHWEALKLWWKGLKVQSP